MKALSVLFLLFCFFTALFFFGRCAPSKTESGNKLLCDAAGSGDLETVRLCVKDGVDLNATYTRPWPVGGEEGPAIVLASAGGHEKVVRFLVEWKAKIPSEALLRAVDGGHDSIISFLLDQGLDVNFSSKQSYFSYGPLHRAVLGNRKSTLELLLARGANLRALNDYGQTPLHVAIDLARKDFAEILAQAGKENERDAFTVIALGAPEEVEKFLTANPPVLKTNPKPLEHLSLLQTATRFGRADIAKLLLQKGADPNWQGERNTSGYQTALQYAAYAGNAELAKILLDGGAKIPENLPGQLRKIPAEGEKREKFLKVAGLLDEYAKRTPN